ncbi:unnamed protein product [Calypogeia fissa]
MGSAVGGKTTKVGLLEQTVSYEEGIQSGAQKFPRCKDNSTCRQGDLKLPNGCASLNYACGNMYGAQLLVVFLHYQQYGDLLDELGIRSSEGPGQAEGLHRFFPRYDSGIWVEYVNKDSNSSRKETELGICGCG